MDTPRRTRRTEFVKSLSVAAALFALPKPRPERGIMDCLSMQVKACLPATRMGLPIRQKGTSNAESNFRRVCRVRVLRKRCRVRCESDVRCAGRREKVGRRSEDELRQEMREGYRRGGHQDVRSSGGRQEVGGCGQEQLRQEVRNGRNGCCRQVSS